MVTRDDGRDEAVPDQLDEDVESNDLEDEDEVEDDQEDHDGEVICPLCRYQMADGSEPYDSCEMCGGSGYIDEDETAEANDSYRIPCIWCKGGTIGTMSYAGCLMCLGSMRMQPQGLATVDGMQRMEDQLYGVAEPVVDVSDLDLASESFAQARFGAGATFRRCRFDEADFYGASLPAARFTDCSFRGTEFEAADLTGSIFTNCDFTGSSLNLARQLDGVVLVSPAGLDAAQAETLLARCQVTAALEDVVGASHDPGSPT